MKHKAPRLQGGGRKTKKPGQTDVAVCPGVARLKGLEPLTYWFVASHSIQLSYRRMILFSPINIAKFKKKVKAFFINL